MSDYEGDGYHCTKYSRTYFLIMPKSSGERTTLMNTYAAKEKTFIGLSNVDDQLICYDDIHAVGIDVWGSSEGPCFTFDPNSGRIDYCNKRGCVA